MLAGLWFSKDKPTMSTYLMPLMNKFNVLHETGEYWDKKKLKTYCAWTTELQEY